MSPRKVIIRWVDRFGVEPGDKRLVVAQVRISKRGWFRWEYEIFWTAPWRQPGRLPFPRLTHVPIIQAGRGLAPTATQCVILSSRWVARHCPH